MRAPEALADAPSDSDLRTWAPGRANLIGEYTDVAEGFVLPVALELRTWTQGRSRGELLRLRSVDEAGEVEVDLATGHGPTEGWGAYATGVVRAIRDAGLVMRGFDGLVASEVPRAAGLSSSAALEVAIAMALLEDPPPAAQVAVACRRAENVYVGVQSGIMDQLSSAAGLAGHALLIDCRTLEVRPVPVPDGLAVMVVDLGVRRSLTDGRYNEVRSDIDAAAAALGVRTLRDASMDDVARAGASGRLSGSVLARARHVVSENQRTLEAADALARDDLPAVGELFAASHRSLREDLRVSVPELDLLVELATATPGVVAARMTGGGYGGCTVNLVRSDAAEAAAAILVGAYDAKTGRSARAWITAAGAGAGRERIAT